MISLVRDLKYDKAVLKLPKLILPVPARLSAVPWSTEVLMNGRPRVILAAFLKPEAILLALTLQA